MIGWFEFIGSHIVADIAGGKHLCVRQKMAKYEAGCEDVLDSDMLGGKFTKLNPSPMIKIEECRGDRKAECWMRERWDFNSWRPDKIHMWKRRHEWLCREGWTHQNAAMEH